MPYTRKDLAVDVAATIGAVLLIATFLIYVGSLPG